MVKVLAESGDSMTHLPDDSELELAVEEVRGMFRAVGLGVFEKSLSELAQELARHLRGLRAIPLAEPEEFNPELKYDPRWDR